MKKPTYHVLPRKDGHVCDVQMSEEEGKRRIVNTFNRECDAWQWITEQEQIDEFHARLQRSRPQKG